MEFKFSREEINALKKRHKLKASDWAESKINILKSSLPGAYKTINNPPQAGIMDIFSLHHVRRGVLKAGVQTGKTQGIHILLAREADYSNGNDNALVVMADEKSVKKLSGNKLAAIFTDSPALKNLISANPDDTTIYSIKLNNNFRIDIGWATSEVSVSSESYRILVLDELAKYKEIGNIFDMKGRTNTYSETCKIWILSSPDEAGSALDTEFESCDIIFDFWPICPHCQEAQVMTFDRMQWPGKDTGTAKSNQVLLRKAATYECKHCGVLWDDNDRDLAILAALDDGEYKGWKPRGEMVDRFRSVGMHYPSWVSPLMSMSEVVSRWIDAQGNPKLIQKWYNTVAGESWTPEEPSAITPGAVMAFASELGRNVVPSDTACLAIVLDTQQNGFYYEVWAFGYAPEIRLHMVRHGHLETFADIEGLMNADIDDSKFKDIDGKEYRITGGLIDSGGTRNGYQKHSRTTEVYEWCSRNRTIIPIKGMHGRSGEMITFKDMTMYPGSNKPIPGGLKRANIRVDIFKDELENKLAKQPDDPGSLSYHSGIDAAFARHFTTERKNEKGDWTHDKNKGRNDYFDCNNYALALREMWKLRIPLSPSKMKKRENAPNTAKDMRQLPGWLQNRRR